MVDTLTNDVPPHCLGDETVGTLNRRPFHNRIVIAVLLPATLVMEPDVIDVTISMALNHRFMWLLLVINSTMAYAANLTNFLVTKNTSALTLQVCPSPPLRYFCTFSVLEVLTGQNLVI